MIASLSTGLSLVCFSIPKTRKSVLVDKYVINDTWANSNQTYMVLQFKDCDSISPYHQSIFDGFNITSKYNLFITKESCLPDFDHYYDNYYSVIWKLGIGLIMWIPPFGLVAYCIQLAVMRDEY